MFNPRPRTLIVRQYTSLHDYEHDARQLEKRGYVVTGLATSTAIGLPTLRHGILHTRYTVTYSFPRSTTTIVAAH